MKITWEKLLCNETLIPKEKAPSSWVDYPMDPFEQDYREIISSVSFRGLQDKAQVYQFGKGDYVRTRLTHSLEVSTTAKQLGIMLLYNSKWNHIPAFSNISVDAARSIPTVLACTGLLHDMGNPPFGHEGEYAITSWFRSHLRMDTFSFFGKPIRELLSREMLADLNNFEGNAQAIRTLSKCRFHSENQEANVSFATISALIKYPVGSTDMDGSSTDSRIHKYGFFSSERDIVKKIRSETGIDIPGEPNARNPLTFLLEAADDIAYVASDIEDAVSRGTITIHSLISFIQNEIDAIDPDGDEMHQLQILTVNGILNNLQMRIDKCNGNGNAETEAFHKWTDYLRSWLMYVTAISFVNNWEAIMDGTYRGDLIRDSHHRYTVEILKKEMRTNVYPRLGQIHIAATTILNDLLDRLINAVIYWDTEQELPYIDTQYIAIIPDSLKSAYMQEKGEDAASNLYLRFRMITDYISGMSDTYAHELYKKLNAIHIS